MRKFSWWFIVSTIVMVLIVVPNIEIIKNIFAPATDTWKHISQYLLTDYIINTLILAISTAIVTVIIGATTAFIVTVYDFPFRNFFKWAMILPLSIPPYIGGYTYSGLLSYTGAIQTFLRNIGVEVNQSLFNIFSLQGAIFIFTIFLYPYVYMMVKANLEKESSNLIESARTMNKSMFTIFLKVVMPLSRVVLVASTTLVMLEVVSDYGVVSYFGVHTLSAGIFNSWFNLGDISSAFKVAGYLLIIVFGAMLIERTLRGNRKYSSNTKSKPISRKDASKTNKILFPLYFFTVLSVAFFIPILQMLHWAFLSYKEVLNFEFITLAVNTVTIAIIPSILIIVISLIIGNFIRLHRGKISTVYSKITVIGYSIPGAITAITVVIFFNNLDRNLVWLYKIFNPNSITLLMSSSLIMLIFAYVVRFLAVGYQSVEGGYEKISRLYYEASKTLGKNTTKTFMLVDIPMLKPAIISGISLVFVDIVKELPLALILRPFNFDTLATKVFVYASDELVIRGAIPSLFIIFVSIVAIFLINKLSSKEA